MYNVLKQVPDSRYPLYSNFSIFIEFRAYFAMLIHADQQPATACMIPVAAVYRTATGHTSTKFSSERYSVCIQRLYCLLDKYGTSA